MKKIYIATLFTVLSLLTFKNTNAQCVANYSLTIGTGGNVTFTSTSVGTSTNTMYYWAFGDGGTFTAFNNIFASHTYTANGSYSAYLFIYDTLATSTCSAGIAFTVPITGLACGGSPNFSTSTAAAGLVYFTSTSTGVAPNSTYSWNFGDGNTANTGFTSTAPHTYTAGGTYTVTMVITDPLAVCSYTTSQTVSVTIIPCNLVSNFTYTNGAAGLVNFTSTSTGTTPTTVYYWDFGDGFNGSGANPSHTYATNGNFNVILQLQDSILVNCWDTTYKSVSVTNAPCLASSSFSVTKDSSMAFTWKALPFYNPNTIAASWNWGDGNTTVGLYPSHTYSAAGIYNICLTVTVSCTSGPITSSTCVNSNIFKMNGNEETAAMIYINVINPLSAGIQTSSITDISFDVFPNPNNGEVTLQISNSPLKEVGIAIYNIIGENIYKSTLIPTNGSIKTKLNLNELANGTYFIRVEGQNTSKKLIILK